jgi:ketosteroid isomerase-like protein
MKVTLAAGALLLVAAALAISASRGSFERRAEEEIRAQVRAWDQAYQRRDLQTLGRILTEDFRLTDATGAVLSRGEYFMSVVKSPEFNQIASFDSRDVTVRVDGDTAIVRGRSAVKGRGRGRAQLFGGNYLFTDDWVRQDGVWKARQTRVRVAAAE